MSGTLYLIATPIGNPRDITLRALDVLAGVDLVVIEERREGDRLLREAGITKPSECLNEHNEAAATQVILSHLLAGKNVGLISDAGTPVFSDPGRLLVRGAVERNIRVVPVPGASSLMPALTVSGFGIDSFVFAGWLSPKKERRRAELRQLRQERRAIVLMDTPYRLGSLMADLAEAFGDARQVCIAFNLTMPDEKVFHGTAASLRRELAARPLKGEFVVVIEGRSLDPSQKGPASRTS